MMTYEHLCLYKWRFQDLIGLHWALVIQSQFVLQKEHILWNDIFWGTNNGNAVCFAWQFSVICTYYIYLNEGPRVYIVESLTQSSNWKFEFTGPKQILEFILCIYLNKNWKMYWFEQIFTGLRPEDRCSSWGL